jgi:hypothetical protein
MKMKLFAAVLFALALNACAKKEEVAPLPPPATQPSLSAPASEPAAAPAAPVAESAPAQPAAAQDSAAK